ncbi:asparagine rich protein, putative [Plasmodium berghei]|uniref:Apical asparagine-rich protein AARP, putative n=2 Tax=Plasmodium berghei TaxID=5821 RepID=A0A509AGN2_PLABA|nr:apical asparagine-rich protein AARP, putative [Plasmodium berghei ANKA]CXI13348.1 asparagine rich protein, putative [Plasmodium berghei]SCL93493.1 asparagine rich protein, putative [Plasmodium berghei]SCM15875.1 asparagine rich protein, putative [Plasmodium berghei]SCM17671.1 asparagine rich protein, putative [Plasmodium berghei]SCN23222.1 asparagine rich protein, putative [Plasmodium berghei]|eukprot:XP_034420479.1 apical asparagine-rich protein AARP, putative [Plasmodium berghei ANKA]
MKKMWSKKIINLFILCTFYYSIGQISSRENEAKVNILNKMGHKHGNLKTITPHNNINEKLKDNYNSDKKESFIFLSQKLKEDNSNDDEEDDEEDEDHDHAHEHDHENNDNNNEKPKQPETAQNLKEALPPPPPPVVPPPLPPMTPSSIAGHVVSNVFQAGLKLIGIP